MLLYTHTHTHAHTHTHHSLISQGMIVTSDPDAQFFGGDADDIFSFADAMAVLLSAGYVANVHPGFDSRYAIIIASSNPFNS